MNALLYVFIASGVLTGCLWAIKFGFWSGFRLGVIFAIGLTLFVALVILPLDFFLTKRVSNRELELNQTEELRLTGHVEDVFQRSLEILSRLGIIKSIQPLRDKMMIAARTKTSLFSFGEEITLRFIAVGKGQVEIQISSEPVFGYTKIDYGKNLRNVRLIGKAVTESLITSVAQGKETG
ncbi:MAG: hypothetical protein ACREQ2_12605 [Candidatus Binatia bacterium]